MGQAIKSLSIEGFKSIRRLDAFELRPLNVLIGANGSGKSNFVDFFRLLRAMADENLTGFVNRQGGADRLFFLGPKVTPRVRAELRFGHNQYGFGLEPTADNEMVFSEEVFRSVAGMNSSEIIARGGKESKLRARVDEQPPAEWDGVRRDVLESISNLTVYHFHDTSALAPMRRDQSVRDFEYLRPDASNIAAYLLRLQTEPGSVYSLIRDTVTLIAPFFDDFLLRPETRGSQEIVRLEWRQRGSDYPFQPSQLSDGTLRFICLTTALLQPHPPATLVIDEPELGLHPHALEVIAGLIRKAASRTQVVVSTQSAPLLSQFNPEDVVVVRRREEASEFHRLDSRQLGSWLEEYTLGELWQKNYVEGASYG